MMWKDKIMKVVMELAQEKTVILISHRLANVVKADRIYVIGSSDSIDEWKTGRYKAGRTW